MAAGQTEDRPLHTDTPGAPDRPAPTGRLASLIERHAPGSGLHVTPIERLSLIRADQPMGKVHSLHKPALCIMAQGRKRVVAGERVLTYDPARYLVVSVDLPVTGEILDASPEHPYLCVSLEIDPALLGHVLIETGTPAPRADSGSGVTVATLDDGLADAVCRLVALLDSPGDAGYLAPLVEREILYRLLTSGHAAMLQRIAYGESRMQQVNRALKWLKENYAAPFSMAQLAREAGMSASALHQHFKSVTEMTPLQYQKQLRLMEARRLILSNHTDAAGAGHQVGYDSPSQFSREYRRFFGAPPMQDVERLRREPEAAAGV